MLSTDFAPLRFRERRLDAYQPVTTSAARALDAARRFVSGQLGSLVFAGPTGVGKTHLAVCAAADRFAIELDAWNVLPIVNNPAPWEKPRKERREPTPPDWCSVPELIVGLRADMDRDREDRGWADRSDELARWKGTVILDDLGREKTSDWTGETIYTLVNGRYERMLPTIVTTNLTGAELAASPYWPVISRLAEGGELVRIEAADHRLAKRVKGPVLEPEEGGKG